MPHYLRCYECKKKVDMYEEKVYTWSRADHQSPRGFTDDMLCEKCHIGRIGDQRANSKEPRY
jgi:hypothetical protein